MKKIMNNPSHIVYEMVEGIMKSSCGLLRQVPDTGVLYYTGDKKGKVGLVSGGGSGHEPAHAGFVGKGMLTAAVCGQVFTSPTPDQILEGIRIANSGSGVFLVIKNYSGDVMNFDMAKDLAEMEGIAVRSIVVGDDIAVENSTFTQGKRGVAGTLLVHKILGALADLGKSLDEIEQTAQQLVLEIGSIGFALSGATVPEVGKPGFILGENEIEYGVGIHGEPGYRRETLSSSHQMAEELIGKLDSFFSFQSGENYGVLVNGLGATPLMEQYVFAADVLDLLEKEGLFFPFVKVGNYMTSIDMAGLSLSMIRLKENWLELLQKPVQTLAW